MSFINPTLLQSYMFADGSNHLAVKPVKAFLNASPKTPINNLPIDTLFVRKREEIFNKLSNE